MGIKWENSRVSTPERIFYDIQNKMAQPVGVMLFGSDCRFKNEVYNECSVQLPGIATNTEEDLRSTNMVSLRQPLSEGRSVLAVLDSEASISRECRHQVVVGLREMGAKSVVGIYAKTEESLISPTADGLDDFITATRKEG